MTIEIHDGEPRPLTEIKVLGVGGGGSNAVNRMIASGLRNVRFLAVNTDLQALELSRAEMKVPIGSRLTQGLGAGGDPEIGEKAALEDQQRLEEVMRDANMIFIAAGMGGGTGTGAAPVIARTAREAEILTVAVVTKPFDFERARKRELAEAGIERLRKEVDTLIIIPNQQLLRTVEKKATVREAFYLADDVLRQGVQGISDLITEPGEINIDFADVRTVMEAKGDALMGVGVGAGENRAVDAATAAINNPLLEHERIEGAEAILVNVTGGEDMGLAEFEEVCDLITTASNEALVISGMATNPDLNDELRVTVVATGFNREAAAAEPEPEAEAEPEKAEAEAEAEDLAKVFTYEEFMEVHGRKGRSSRFDRSGDGEDLDVPAVVRRQRTAQGGR